HHRDLHSFPTRRSSDLRLSCSGYLSSLMSTEGPSSRYAGIDLWQADEIVDAMIEAQFDAVAAARAARSSLQEAAIAMEARLRFRGRLVYAGAGTSGRLAVQDGAELMP